MKNTSSLATTAIEVTLVAGSANATTQNDYVVSPGVHDADGTITLDNVRAAGAGYVEIIDYRVGELGDVLGSSKINTDANTDVNAHVGISPLGGVMAVLYDASGNTVASEKSILMGIDP